MANRLPTNRQFVGKFGRKQMITLTNPRKHIFILVTFFIALSFALALLMVLSSTHTAQAAPVAGGTNVSGPIITHTTWTVAGSPYIMIDDVTVNSGITLTIEPNVTVMGELDTSLTINGHLQAIGTKQQHITFTSVLNSGANEWNALFFKSGSGQLEYAIMRYAEIGVCPVDWLSVGTSTHLVVKNSVIYSNSIGVCAENFFLNGQVVIENTVIRDNLNYAISSSTKGLPGLHMTNVLFQDNGYDRIHVQAFDTEYLIDDTILTAQPGLEGYEIYGDDFIIPVGITMTIEPGVTVMVDDEGFGGAIGVLGSLQAIGTITQPITFTSALNSGPGQWDGVGMGGNVHFDNVVYRYGNGIGVVNMAEGAMAIIENSVIENNASNPIGVEAESLHQLQISNTTFLNNNHNRIVISIDNGSLVDDVILRPYTG
jgi:hypothetical protein